MVKGNSKLNIFLDLDNTLISSVSKEEEKALGLNGRKKYKPKMKKFRWKNMENVYKVFERPGLQPFLDFLFEHFNVSVWTAASKSYALFVIDNFILNNPDRTLDYIFFSHHCKQSNRLKRTQKSLQIIEKHFRLPNYNIQNTFIIDDHPEVFKSQPSNCIPIKPFDFMDRQSYNDEELRENIMPRLQTLLDNGTFDPVSSSV